MFEKDVTTKDGHVKNVVAQTQEELDEAVKVIKNDVQAVSPDLTVPGDNAIVSPDNLHTEPIPSVVDNAVEPEVAPEPKEAPSEKEFVGTVDEFEPPKKASKPKK